MDVVVGVAILVLLYVIVRVGRGTTVSFAPSQNTSIDTDPANLPYYAARSLLRMFTALGRVVRVHPGLRLHRGA